MRGNDRAIRVLEAADEVSAEQVRRMFGSYAAEFADSIAESLCFQGFESELAGLPGRYGPPPGASCWRWTTTARPGAWPCVTWAAARAR